MDNFKFNFRSWGQLESFNLDRIFLPLFKILPCQEEFLVLNFCHYCSNVVQKTSSRKGELKVYIYGTRVLSRKIRASLSQLISLLSLLALW